MSAFGIREVCHCVFTAKDTSKHPSFIIDTAKMSTLESTATTVYAQGGSGNSRLLAWEGEKTLTFTIEDALMTRESFRALTGASVADNTYKVYPTSFAGYYSITAYTLVRQQSDGKDYLATITIPNAKLQTTLNLSMSATGDPSTFTFTFDAFPDPTNDDKNLMFSLALATTEFTGDLADRTADTSTTTTTVYINGTAYTTESTAPTLAVAAAGAVSLGGTALENVTVTGTGVLANLSSGTNLKRNDDVDLLRGSTSYWYNI